MIPRSRAFSPTFLAETVPNATNSRVSGTAKRSCPATSARCSPRTLRSSRLGPTLTKSRRCTPVWRPSSTARTRTRSWWTSSQVRSFLVTVESSETHSSLFASVRSGTFARLDRRRGRQGGPRAAGGNGGCGDQDGRHHGLQQACVVSQTGRLIRLRRELTKRDLPGSKTIFSTSTTVRPTLSWRRQRPRQRRPTRPHEGRAALYRICSIQAEVGRSGGFSCLQRLRSDALV